MSGTIKDTTGGAESRVRFTVKFYAHFQDITHKKTEEFEVAGTEVRVEDFLQILAKRFPNMKSYLPSAKGEEALSRNMVILVNGREARLSDVIREGDEVGVLPPVFGGVLER
ncbi:MAG: MoaD/ThiS family protein [Candidatus Geothermarchaeales archaeon]